MKVSKFYSRSRFPDLKNREHRFPKIYSEQIVYGLCFSLKYCNNNFLGLSMFLAIFRWNSLANFLTSCHMKFVCMFKPIKKPYQRCSDDVSDFTYTFKFSGKERPIGFRNTTRAWLLHLLWSPLSHTVRESMLHKDKDVASHPEFLVRLFQTSVSFTTAWRVIYLRERYSLSHVNHQTISPLSLCYSFSS